MMSLTHQKYGVWLGKNSRAEISARVLPITEYTVTLLVYMESAWEKITGLKFEFCEKKLLANGVTKKQPFYQLTKTECLYIATKFNDEARAKLVR